MESRPYGGIAGFYDRVFGRVLEGVHGAVVEVAPAGRGARVLDVGCGTGLLLSRYKERGALVHGIDSSRDMLGVARGRLPGGVLVHGDAARMPFESESFHVVASTMALHEMSPSTRRRVLAEMGRVAKRDGLVVVGDYSTPERMSPTGWAVRRMIGVVERMAGRDHHRNYERFLREGGVESIPRMMGWRVVREKRVLAGNIGVLALSPGD